jgi:hypothetical protein
MENTVRDLRTTGSTQFTLVVDMKDLSMKQLCNKPGTYNLYEFLFYSSLFSSSNGIK